MSSVWEMLKRVFGDDDKSDEGTEAPFEREEPSYYCEMVSRDTYHKTELGDPWETGDYAPIGEVVEGFYDSRENKYVLVIRI